jgi:hypothetical protein
MSPNGAKASPTFHLAFIINAVNRARSRRYAAFDCCDIAVAVVAVLPDLLMIRRIDNSRDLDEGVRTQIKRAYELSVWS